MKAMLDERTSAILFELIREHIRTAEPVSSGDIALLIEDQLSPATVRNRFAELTAGGYLEQPHTSAGRIPTERAYRLFIDELLHEHEREIIRRTELNRRRAEALAEIFADELHLLSGTIDEHGRMIHRGFHEVLQKPEFATEEMRMSFGALLDHLAKREYYPQRSSILSILLGEEIEEPNIRRVGVLFTPMRSGEIFFAAGPQRMDYERIIRHFLEI